MPVKYCSGSFLAHRRDLLLPPFSLALARRVMWPGYVLFRMKLTSADLIALFLAQISGASSER